MYKEIGDDMRMIISKIMQIRKTHEQDHFGINKTEMLVKPTIGSLIYV